MYVVGGLLAIAFFVLLFLAWKNGSKYSGFYKTIGVCGRWYATVSMSALLGGVIFAIASVVIAVMAMLGKVDTLPEDMSMGQSSPIGSALVLLLTAAIAIAIGLLMYLRVYKKCPDDLKPKFFWHMLMMMLDGSIRISFFFLVFIYAAWFHSAEPKRCTVDGETFYHFPGSRELYDVNGNLAGTINSDNTTATMF